MEMAMTVSVLAKQVGITPDTVRHYVRIGLVKPKRHPHNRYGLYNEADANCICFIHIARTLGYTLKEIGMILAEAKQGQTLCPRAREIIQKRIAPNNQKLRQMNRMQTRFEDALTVWSHLPNGVPDGQAIQRLMTSCCN